jgi:drug/metabolite transporter (DMT)-like permease
MKPAARSAAMTIPDDVALLVLLSAALNAGWNSAVKVGADRLSVMAVTTLIAAVAAAFALPWVQMPVRDSWGLLALSIALHTAYHFMLPLAYNHGDLGQIYPIARGSAPLMVMGGAAALAGERPGAGQLLGIAVLCAGVIALSMGRAGHAHRWKAVAYALATGALIAAYTVSDGLGARQSGAVLGFAALMNIGGGVATSAGVLLWKGPAAFRLSARDWRLCALAAVMQMGASWIAVWALARAPMGLVSALRETSVLFVALISAFLLKEKLGLKRLLPAALVFAGIVCIRFG